MDRLVSVDVVARTMSNDKLAITWTEDGSITSIFDRVANRELLRPDSRGASLTLGVDLPNEYDAWDLEHWARRSNIVLENDAVSATTVEAAERGPLVGILKVHRTFGQSAVTQRFALRAGSARLDVEFDIDWHEDEKVLSVEFPLDVHSDHVDCGIQFGSVARPRYPNTSWDAAKFEVCAHRWVDVSEPGFGVAILNDGRYGHAVQGDSIAVTLLRAPNWPDPTADRGFHRTTISVFPHAGDRCAVVGEAEALNTPLRVVRGTNQDALPQPIAVIPDGRVEVSAIKRADDRSGDVVVRMFERTGAVAALLLTVGSGKETTNSDHASMFQRTNLLEDREPEHGVGAVVTDGAHVRLRPFEIVTLRGM